jgi:hypothetical protein
MLTSLKDLHFILITSYSLSDHRIVCSPRQVWAAIITVDQESLSIEKARCRGLRVHHAVRNSCASGFGIRPHGGTINRSCEQEQSSAGRARCKEWSEFSGATVPARAAPDPAAQTDFAQPAAFNSFAAADAELLKTDCIFELEQVRRHPRLLVFNLIVSNLYYDGEFMGMLNNLIENFSYHFHSKKQPIWLQEFATLPRLIGKGILITGTSLDLSIEKNENKEKRRQGVDIDSLDAKMMKLAQAADVARTELMGSGLSFSALNEAKLLDDIAIRKRSENVERGLTIFNKLEVSLGSDVVRVVAAPLRLGVLSGLASISTTFAGSETAIQGLIAQYMAHKKGKQTARKMASKFGELPTYDDAWSQFETDIQAWSKLTAQARGALDVVTEKRQFYSEAYEALVFLEQVNYSLQKRDQAGVKRESQLHLIGSTQGVRGLMSTIAGFPPTSLNGVHATELNAAASIPYVVGTGLRATVYGFGGTAKTIINHKKDKAASEKVTGSLHDFVGAFDSSQKKPIAR